MVPGSEGLTALVGHTNQQTANTIDWPVVVHAARIDIQTHDYNLVLDPETWLFDHAVFSLAYNMGVYTWPVADFVDDDRSPCDVRVYTFGDRQLDLPVFDDDAATKLFTTDAVDSVVRSFVGGLTLGKSSKFGCSIRSGVPWLGERRSSDEDLAGPLPLTLRLRLDCSPLRHPQGEWYIP